MADWNAQTIQANKTNVSSLLYKRRKYGKFEIYQSYSVLNKALCVTKTSCNDLTWQTGSYVQDVILINKLKFFLFHCQHEFSLIYNFFIEFKYIISLLMRQTGSLTLITSFILNSNEQGALYCSHWKCKCYWPWSF